MNLNRYAQRWTLIMKMFVVLQQKTQELETDTQRLGDDGRLWIRRNLLSKRYKCTCKFCKENFVPTPILDAVIKRNEEIDRFEKDWMADKGRAVSAEVDPKEKKKKKA